jgi:hypothetical protein
VLGDKIVCLARSIIFLLLSAGYILKLVAQDYEFWTSFASFFSRKQKSKILQSYIIITPKRDRWHPYSCCLQEKTHKGGWLVLEIILGDASLQLLYKRSMKPIHDADRNAFPGLYNGLLKFLL